MFAKIYVLKSIRSFDIHYKTSTDENDKTIHCKNACLKTYTTFTSPYVQSDCYIQKHKTKNNHKNH